MPHAPWHMSIHLLLEHALSNEQSLFVTHSGRQPRYGSPKYSGAHVHAPAEFLTVHIALGPQGDGLQGFVSSSLGIVTINEKYVLTSI